MGVGLVRGGGEGGVATVGRSVYNHQENVYVQKSYYNLQVTTGDSSYLSYLVQ